MTTGNYILLGPPGSGKSTQAEFLRKKLGLVHIDIGSELRAAAEEDTPFGHELNVIINHKRELAPDTVMEKVLQNTLARVPEGTGVLLDGAPRRKGQIEHVLEALKASGRPLTKAIFIQLSEAESVERISKRYLCFGCHRPYIMGKDITEKDAVCIHCGGKIGQRKDDTPEGVRKRFQIFHTDTLPVIEYFKEQGKLLTVDGNQGSDAIFQRITEELAK